MAQKLYVSDDQNLMTTNSLPGYIARLPASGYVSM